MSNVDVDFKLHREFSGAELPPKRSRCTFDLIRDEFSSFSYTKPVPLAQ